MKKLLFIYNPHAGQGLIKGKLADVIDIFAKAGYVVTTYPTQAYRDGYKMVKKFKEKYDILVCSGGDGTLDEIVSGMMKRPVEKRIPIGYIPAGSTNDFANSLKIPKNMLEAADTVVNGEIFHCDVGRFNQETFVYIAAFGLFTDVSYETPQNVKNVLGHLAYVLEGAKRIYNIPSYVMKVEYDGNVIEDEFIYGMITNSRSVGGFKNIIGKNVVFDDGEFEVTLIKKPKNLLELQEIIAALLIETMDTHYMYSFRANKITFESDEEIPWTQDGEFGGVHARVEIENIRRGLDIVVQKEEIRSLMKHPEEYIPAEIEDEGEDE